MITTVAVRPPVGVSRLAAPWRALRQSACRWRLLGGLAFSVLSLGAFVLVARYLSDASWPLDGAHAHLVFLAGGSYLASFGFRAFGWHLLFRGASAPTVHDVSLPAGRPPPAESSCPSGSTTS